MGKAEITKQIIIEKAAVIFNKNGYQRTSMSSLARALGLTKGALYGNFADKDDIAVEAFRYSSQQIVNKIRLQLQEQKDPVNKLRMHARGFLDIFDEMCIAGGCPILNTAVDSDDAHPRLHEEVRNFLITWEKRLVEMVSAGKASGAIRSDADAIFFASSFIALVEGGIHLAKTVGDKKYLEISVKQIDLLIDQMLVDLKTNP